MSCVLNGCVLWGSRVVVPPQGRKVVLQDLHETHPGASRMKSLARSYIWWPKMDSNRIASQIVLYLPRITPITSSCSTAPLAMAKPAIESFTLGLRRTVHGSNVSDHCGCAFQMDGCSHYVIYHIHQNHPNPSICFRYALRKLLQTMEHRLRVKNFRTS